jgi:glycosyltransferase involved in cell wall biosynthesis
MNCPLISVLMTAYNREKYIAEAIESILASTYTNFELIIVDDYSVDNTVAIAKKFETKDKRIKVYVNEKNLGDYPNRNKAAGYAKGKYLKYLDSDDMLYPDGLRYCVQCMEDNKEADWAIFYPIGISKEFLLDPKEAIESHFFKEPFLKAGPGGTIINRDFFLKIGLYPTLYGPANDMYFNLYAASKGNVLVLKDNFLFYRRHDEQEQSNQFNYLYNYCKYLKDALKNLKLPLTSQQINWLQKKRKRRFALNITKYFLRTGNILKTKEAIIKAEFSFKDFFTGIFHFDSHPGKYMFTNMNSFESVEKPGSGNICS